MDFQQIQQLVNLVENSQISEIDLQDSEQQQRIRIKNAFTDPNVQTANVTQSLMTQSRDTLQDLANQPSTLSNNAIVSDQVGWLQLAPDAVSANKINIGDSVAVGDIVAWVSVMDRLLPIESRKAGTITKILLENKQAVEYGTPLFELA